MKRLGLISAIVIPLVLFGFFVSCDNGGGLTGYYIYAELDGTAYEWKLGVTGIDDDAFGSLNVDDDMTEIFATPEVVTLASLSEEYPSNYVIIDLGATTTGTYSISDLFSVYRINAIRWIFTDITLVITAYEDVGGVIKGTFSGTVQEEGSSNTMTVENGQLNVIRVPDNLPW